MCFVLDKRGKPLMPCSGARARKLLRANKAVVHRFRPFTIRLKARMQENSVIEKAMVKLDPGATKTGIAVVAGKSCLVLATVEHKTNISARLHDRKAARRMRRTRRRYRQPASRKVWRSTAKKDRKNFYPPSLRSHVEQAVNAVKIVMELVPVSSLLLERWDEKNTKKTIQSMNLLTTELEKVAPVARTVVKTTAYNAKKFMVGKEKYHTALCIGKMDELPRLPAVALVLQTKGRGSRQMRQNDANGNARQHRVRHKTKYGFRSGDLCRKIKGSRTGHVGYIVVRETGIFYFSSMSGEKRISASHKQIELLQRGRGWFFREEPIAK